MPERGLRDVPHDNSDELYMQELAKSFREWEDSKVREYARRAEAEQSAIETAQQLRDLRYGLNAATQAIADIPNSLKEINAELQSEADDRSRDDKKYFWLGALFSLVTAILVEHGAELPGLLLRLFQ